MWVGDCLLTHTNELELQVTCSLRNCNGLEICQCVCSHWLVTHWRHLVSEFSVATNNAATACTIVVSQCQKRREIWTMPQHWRFVNVVLFTMVPRHHILAGNNCTVQKSCYWTIEAHLFMIHRLLMVEKVVFFQKCKELNPWQERVAVFSFLPASFFWVKHSTVQRANKTDWAWTVMHFALGFIHTAHLTDLEKD